MDVNRFDAEYFETASGGGARSSASRAGRSSSAASPRQSGASSSRPPASSGARPPQRQPSAAGGARQPSARGSSSTRPPRDSSPFGALGSTIDRVGSYAQQAWNFAQGGLQGIQQAQQFAAALGLGGAPSSAQGAQPQVPGQSSAPGGDAGAMPAAAAPQAPGGMDTIASLLQALQQRQIPALPGTTPPPAAAPPPAPQTDALGLLRTILTNPQLQQALQPAAAGAPAPAVQLPVPAQQAPAQQRAVQLPLGAVLNAIAALSRQGMTELYEQTAEDEAEVPAYLVGEDGGLLVDPASADDRAALVAHLFRLNAAARRSGPSTGAGQGRPARRRDWDDSDAWARAAGFP